MTHPKDTDLTLLRVGRLFDGTGSSPQEQMAVLIEGSKISSVAPAHELGLPDGSSGEVLEFPSATLLPGLIDSHTHTNMPGNGRRGEDVHVNDDDDIRLLRSVQNVGVALRTGVTTVGDCGGWNLTTFSLKEGIQQGLVSGPRLLASGRPITTTGGHCWFMGSEADGVDGVRKAARQLIKDGADFLKVMATGGSTVGTDPFRPAFSAEELRAIVEEGHRRGKLVTAHCRTNVAMRMVIDAGFDGIMHGWFTDSTGARLLDEALADHLVQHEVWVAPTLHITRSRIIALEGKNDRGEITSEEKAQLDRMRASHEQLLIQTKRLLSLGVKFIVGSDCGWGVYPFGHLYLELDAMVSGGLTASGALVAATSGSAQALGLSNSIGTVSTGMDADLLIVEGSPDVQIADIKNVSAVFRSGVRVC